MFSASSFQGQQVHRISRKHCLLKTGYTGDTLYAESMRETEWNKHMRQISQDGSCLDKSATTHHHPSARRWKELAGEHREQLHRTYISAPLSAQGTWNHDNRWNGHSLDWFRMRQRELKRAVCSTPLVMWRKIQKKKKKMLSDCTQTWPKARPKPFGCCGSTFGTAWLAECGNVLVYTEKIISDGSGTNTGLIEAIFFSEINTKTF